MKSAAPIILESGDFDDRTRAERLEGIVREAPLPTYAMIRPFRSSVETRAKVTGPPPGVRPASAPNVFCSPSTLPRMGAVATSTSGTYVFAQLPQWKKTYLSGSPAQLLFQSANALGTPDASCSAYIVRRGDQGGRSRGPS